MSCAGEVDRDGEPDDVSPTTKFAFRASISIFMLSLSEYRGSTNSMEERLALLPRRYLSITGLDLSLKGLLTLPRKSELRDSS